MVPVALAISYATLDTSRCGISAVRTSSSASSLSIPRASARFSRNRVLGRDQWPRSRFAIELGEQPASEARSAWVSRCVRRWNSSFVTKSSLGSSRDKASSPLAAISKYLCVQPITPVDFRGSSGLAALCCLDQPTEVLGDALCLAERDDVLLLRRHPVVSPLTPDDGGLHHKVHCVP